MATEVPSAAKDECTCLQTCLKRLLFQRTPFQRLDRFKREGLPAFQNDSNFLSMFNKRYMLSTVLCMIFLIQSNSSTWEFLSLMTFLIAPCRRCPFMLETIVARNYMCDLIKPNFPLNLIVLYAFLFLLLETLNSEENETKEVMFSSFNFFKINFVAISSFAILYTRLHDYSGNLPEYLLKVKS